MSDRSDVGEVGLVDASWSLTGASTGVWGRLGLVLPGAVTKSVSLDLLPDFCQLVGLIRNVGTRGQPSLPLQGSPVFEASGSLGGRPRFLGAFAHPYQRLVKNLVFLLTLPDNISSASTDVSIREPESVSFPPFYVALGCHSKVSIRSIFLMRSTFIGRSFSSSLRPEDHQHFGQVFEGYVE